MVELETNQGELRRLRGVGLWGGAPGGPRRSAWDAHGIDVVRVADPALMNGLVDTYRELDAIARVIALAEEPGPEGEGFEDVFTGEHAATIDKTIELLDEVMVRLWVLWHPKYRIWITKACRWLRAHRLLPAWADPVERSRRLAARRALAHTTRPEAS